MSDSLDDFTFLSLNIPSMKLYITLDKALDSASVHKHEDLY